MIRIEQVREDITRDKKVVDIQVSTSQELPALNENVDGIIIAAGSIAQVIQTGKWFTLDENGEWYFSGGGSAPDDNSDT